MEAKQITKKSLTTTTTTVTIKEVRRFKPVDDISVYLNSLDDEIKSDVLQLKDETYESYHIYVSA